MFVFWEKAKTMSAEVLWAGFEYRGLAGLGFGNGWQFNCPRARPDRWD